MSLTLARWAFLLLVVSLPVVTPVQVAVAGSAAPLTDFLFPVAFALLMLAAYRRRISLASDRLFLFVAVYGAALALSALGSPHRSQSLVRLAGEVYLFALCFMAYQLARDGAFAKRIVLAWLAGTALTILGSVAGIALFYSGRTSLADNPFLYHFGTLPAGHYPRVRSLFGNANMLANYLTVSVMLLLLASRTALVGRAAARVLQAGTSLAALATLSPGLGGTVLAGALWRRANLLERGRRRLALATVAAGVSVAIAFVLAIIVSPDTANTDQDVRVLGHVIEPSARVLAWESALGTLASHPLTGTGLGVGPADVHYVVLSGETQHIQDAHDMVLDVAGQSGLIGLAAFLALALHLLRRLRLEGGSGDDDRTRFALSCAMVGAFFYHGISGSFEETRHIWVLIGIFAAVCPTRTGGRAAARSAPAGE